MSDSHKYSCHGGSTTCACQSVLLKVLQKYFGFSSFRPGQMESARSVIHGQDVFVRMGTGSGKSLCMFLGPLALSDAAIGVIISPLNALMQQQVCIV
jgi:ATP-dependent DNA helicase RecQ